MTAPCLPTLVQAAVFYAATGIAVSSACEKWTLDIVKLGSNTTGYAKTYLDYTQGKIDDDRFAEKKQDSIGKLETLKAKVSSEDSCEHEEDKYEKRKAVLLKWIDKLLATINANEAVASEWAETIREDFFAK
jgi:hypothetical protein